MTRILITGATGFIGSSLALYLSYRNFDVIAAVRQLSATLPTNIQQINTGDLLPDTDWSNALISVNTVIHLAARAHVLRDASIDPLAEFRRTNTAATLNFARQASAAGVKRFIFISSIGVNGNQTKSQPFTAEDIPSPVEPYAISKLEAEVGLRQIAQETGMEVVIIRPPLVYGANAPGNFGLLIKAVARGIPLPLGAIQNKRSLIALENLTSLIGTCITHPAAANQIFLASDGEDISTTELLKRLGHALAVPPRLLPIPNRLLIIGLGLLGKGAMAHKLCDSLQVDIQKTRAILNWTAPLNVDSALRQTATEYKQKISSIKQNSSIT